MIKTIDDKVLYIIESTPLLETTFMWSFKTDIHTSFNGKENRYGLSDDPTFRIRMMFHDYKIFSRLVEASSNMRKTFLIPVFFVRYDLETELSSATEQVMCDTSLYPYIQVGTYFNASKDGYDVYLVKDKTEDSFILDRVPEDIECLDLMLPCVIDKDIKAETSEVFANYSMDFISLIDLSFLESDEEFFPFNWVKEAEYLSNQYSQHQILHNNDISAVHSFTDWVQCKYSSAINLVVYNINDIFSVLEFFKSKRGALYQFQINGFSDLVNAKTFRFGDEISMQCLGGFNFEFSSDIIEVL